VDRDTVAAYEGSAGYYGEYRRAYQPDRAEAFAAALPAGGARLDLGSGPGHYLPHLGTPVVAADPAVAMLVEARRRYPATPAVACEAGALPFRRGAVAGVWASKCLQHVPAGQLPQALGELHRVMPVGGVLDLTVFDGGGDPGHAQVTGPDDDIPGRLFSLWGPDDLGHLLTGAGFAVDELAAAGGDRLRRVVARAGRARTLADTVGPGMRVLACGLNPSLYAADAGVGFARPGNRFWPAAVAAGLATVARDPVGALRDHGLGMTDLVKRATARAAELSVADYRAGLDRVRWLVRWLRPRAVCFVGLAGWRAAVDRRAQPGVQPGDIEGAPVYVMPSTSGLNASARLDDLVEHLRRAAALADGSRPDR
jgi:TDG/mug DNA glycosylase family protein